MSDNTDQQDLYTAAQFREYQDGYGERSPDVYPHAGIVRDEKVSRLLTMLAIHYDPTETTEPERMPGRAEDLRMAREIRRACGTDAARKALSHGDTTTLKHLTGDAGQRRDVSGLQAIDALTDMVVGPAPMFYVWAEPGAGKTNFALLLAQLWTREHGPDALMASNIRTLKETDAWEDDEGNERDGWLATFGELEEWIQQDGDPLDNEQRPKLFIFDEASSAAGGSGDSGYQTKQKMGPLAYKIRKYGGALIVVGHDGKDVHPLIREMGVAVHKEGLKTATFYEDVRNRQGRGQLMRVEGIPETDYRYDDKEPTEWSWHTSEDDDGHEPGEVARETAIYTAIRAKEEGLSNREVAKYVPFSHEWVRSRYAEHETNGGHEETLARVEEVIG